MVLIGVVLWNILPHTLTNGNPPEIMTNKILTLSTCTGNGYSKRFAIHAVCVDAQTTDESKLKETGN